MAGFAFALALDAKLRNVANLQYLFQCGTLQDMINGY